MDQQKSYWLITSIIGVVWLVLMVLLVFFDFADIEIINIKIITYVQISSFLLFGLMISKFKHSIRDEYIDLSILTAFAILMVFLFELLWSFGYWFTTYQIQVNHELISSDIKSLDSVYYDLDRDTQPSFIVNKFKLNYSAKKNTLLFFLSLFLLYSLIELKYLRKRESWILAMKQKHIS